MDFRGKRVAVTGAAGFIGSHFVDALLRSGAQVRAVIHNTPLRPEVQGVEEVRADLLDADQARQALAGVDMVVHAAGSVGAAGLGPLQVMDGLTDNLAITARVLQAAWHAEVGRVLIFSSSAGYAVVDHAVGEDEFWTGPVHDHFAYYSYGWMRRYFERMGEFVGRSSKTEVVIIRPTATFGPRDNFDPKSCHVIPALIRRAVEREAPFVVWGSGMEIRDFLYVEDLVEGCLLALQRAPNMDPINIGFGGSTTVRELVDAVLVAAGYSDADLRFDASKPTTIPVRMVDIGKAQALLGYAPRHTLVEGLAKTVAWYRTFCSQ